MNKLIQKLKEYVLDGLEARISQAVDVAVNEMTTRHAKHQVANTTMISVMKQQHNLLLERTIKIEARSMRDNLKISGMPEIDGETPEMLLANIKSIFTEDLGLTAVIPIVRCHRDPKPTKHKGPRNVTVRLMNHDC